MDDLQAKLKTLQADEAKTRAAYDNFLANSVGGVKTGVSARVTRRTTRKPQSACGGCPQSLRA